MRIAHANSRPLKYRREFKISDILVLGIGLVLLSAPLLVQTLFHPAQVHANASTVSQPTLQALQQVTKQAFGNPNDDSSPNGWGMHKTRIVRMSTGDLFTVYESAGSSQNDRQWHLMHEAPGSTTWQEIRNGDAGQEPINIIRGPNDELHLFAWPGTVGQLQHIESKDLGQTFTTETLPGSWLGAPGTWDENEQGYSGAGINDQGDIVICQIGEDSPGYFNWSYYDPKTNTWTFHASTLDHFRFAYLFLFPGDNGDLSIVGMRDVHREALGYPKAPKNDFDYVFDEIGYFHISDVTNPTITEQVVAQVKPQNNTDYDLAYQSDIYADTQSRIHILYDNMYDGPHHAILQNGSVIKDVKINFPTPSDPAATKMRIIQNASGQFFITDVSNDGKSLYVYPGTANDTDGTQLATPTALDISKYPGCTDDDFCLAPTFAAPRSGNALSDTLDGVYGNFTKQMYIRIQLPDSGTPTPTPTPGTTPTPITTPTPTSTPITTPTPGTTPTPTPTSGSYSFEDGTTDGWSADNTDSLTNSTDYAYDGTHSLKAVINNVATDNSPLVYIANSATDSPAMPAAGQTITAEVFAPYNSPPEKLTIFVKDSAGNQFNTPFDQVPALKHGKWFQLQYTVPSTISGQVVEVGIAFNFPGNNPKSLNAYIDNVNW